MKPPGHIFSKNKVVPRRGASSIECFEKYERAMLLRENIREGTSLGATAETDMVKGGLVPDNLVTRLVEERLNTPDARKGFVLEGFPRSLPQAETLDRFLEKQGLKLDAVIDIEVSDWLVWPVERRDHAFPRNKGFFAF